MDETKSQYRALPFIFGLLLLFASYFLNNWYLTVREIVSAGFDVTAYAVYSIVAPLIFALISLLLFASVFNQRLTVAGSIVLLVIGSLIGLQPLLFFTGLGAFMPFVITPYIPLAAALVAVSGYGSLILRPKPGAAA